MEKEHIENIERAFNTVVKLSKKADALKVQYVNDMQTSTGYDVADGAKILKDVAGKMSGVMSADGTYYAVKSALQTGLISVVRVEPSQELTDAVTAVNQEALAFDKLHQFLHVHDAAAGFGAVVDARQRDGFEALVREERKAVLRRPVAGHLVCLAMTRITRLKPFGKNVFELRL